MKQMRTPMILFIVLLALGGIATWDEWKTEQEEKESRTKNTLLPIDFSKITEIRYHRDTEDEESDAVTMVLRKDAEWRLISPIEEKADPVAVENFLKALKDYRYANVISSDPARHAEYSVADDGPRRVTLVSEEKETTLLVGTEAAVGYQAYLRIQGSDDVLIGSQHIRVATNKTLFDFRDKEVIKIDSNKLLSLTIEAREKETIHLTRNGDKWQLNNPIVADADKDQVHDFVNALNMARAASFYNEVEDAMKTHLASPDYRITAVLEGDQHVALSITNHGGKLVGTYDVTQGAFELPDNLRTDLNKDALNFRERKVLRLDANVIDRVEVDADVYVRKDGLWYDAAGKEATHMQALVVDLEFAKTEAFLDWDSAEAKGLPDAPQHRLKFFAGDKDMGVIDLFSNKDAPTTYFVKRHGAPFLYRIPTKEFEGMKPLASNEDSPFGHAEMDGDDQAW